MTVRRSRLLLGCAILAMLAAGCRRGKDRELAEDLIRRYDRALVEAHLTGSTRALEEAAGEEELERVQIFVVTIRGKGQLLLESLERLKVTEAAFGRGSGRAIAEERWSYQRLDARTRTPVTSPSRRDYVMTYLFAPRGTNWVVDKVEFARPSTDAGRAPSELR